ncbi:MAG TPA: MerR family transcriptional regulator [Actinomycetota bacterium]
METETSGWTLDQLAQRVGSALSVDYSGQASGRVREVPDQRAIRWYTTIGLVDRPAAMRGRTALYGRRHLLQLVAIKRLQAAGLSLAEIQRELAGATDAQLERVARVPAREPAPRPPVAAARPAFWRRAGELPAAPAGRRGLASVAEEPPAAAPPGRRGMASVAEEVPVGPSAGGTEPAGAVAMQAVRLEDGVTLLLEGSGELGADEVAAIRAAAEPLLDLVRRGRERA